MSAATKPKEKRPPLPSLETYSERAVTFDPATTPFVQGTDAIYRAKEYNELVEALIAPIEAANGPTPRCNAGPDGHSQWREFADKLNSNVGGGLRFYLREFAPWVWDCRYYVAGRFPFGDKDWQKTHLKVYTRTREKGSVTWDGSIWIPVLDTAWTTWMSLTPNEFLSQRAGIKRARGNVLVGGLGMGWFARECLKRPQVKSVTVVEKSADVIRFFGEPLKKEFGERVSFVQGDAYEAVRPEQYDSVLYDIWPGVGHCLTDPDWRKIAATHKNAWAW